jgi:hypothetical protein
VLDFLVLRFQLVYSKHQGSSTKTGLVSTFARGELRAAVYFYIALKLRYKRTSGSAKLRRDSNSFGRLGGFGGLS